MSEYALDQAVRPIATPEPGRFAVELDDAWRALGGVINGGYSTAVCLRALLEVVDAPDPLIVSTTFLRSAVPGPAEVVVEEVGRTRRNVTAQARLVQDGIEVVRTLATCTNLGEPGPVDAQSTAPRLADPADCVDPYADPHLLDLLAGATMTDHINVRHPALPGWVRGAPAGRTEAEFWIGFADRRPPDTLALPLLVDAAAPIVLEAGATGSSTLQLTTHVRARPAPGWLAARVSTRHPAGGLHEEDMELWDSARRLVAQSRQLAVLHASPG